MNSLIFMNKLSMNFFFITSGPESVMYFQDFFSQFFGIFFFQESKYPWSFNFEYSLSFSLTTNVKEVFL